MSIISHEISKIEAGAKLGQVIQNEESRTAFVEELGARGDVTVLADTADTVHLVIPAGVDSAKVAAGDETYFEELGKLALSGCYYEDLPE